MYITVRFGGELDLSDESGNVKNLRDSPQRYADELLDERETLILLRVEKNENGDCRFTPLLRDKAFITEAFLQQLASKANLGRPSSRRSNRSNSGRRGGNTGKGGTKQTTKDAKDGSNKLSKPANSGLSRSRSRNR